MSQQKPPVVVTFGQAIEAIGFNAAVALLGRKARGPR